MSTHIYNILNTFNRINDIDQSKSIALLKTVSVLRSKLAKVKKVSDAVNHPDHYNIPGRKECINEMLDQFGIDKVMAFCELSAYKYQYRHELKGGNIDLDRAGWCLDKLEVLERVKAGGAFGND